ncbi:hypothetical protein [Cellulophaga sp. BC115SP]|uniref:pirin family protein n=1 Tax=Cellulophaga sp. BC115SP TaxID=2683263 RepID=UPI001411C6D2|nr:hypothetical protein [Cellulophaga sp. BC115SP]NBB28253.1 hypothetical protein [Cellulophaga sp. BC115SP]
MITQTEGRIILSDMQPHTQTPTFHKTHIWEKGETQNYELEYVEKVLLLPNCTFSLPVSSVHSVLIIPYIGDLYVENTRIGQKCIEEHQTFSLQTNLYSEILNPYQDEMVTFFIAKYSNVLAEELNDISIQVSKNEILPIPASSWIGQFDGRQKGELSLSNNHKDILVYVVDGAFEVQDRLLHAEDALLLNSVDVVDFEALSNQAILLIFELALYTKRG